jgi:hypothetical protein
MGTDPALRVLLALILVCLLLLLGRGFGAGGGGEGPYRVSVIKAGKPWLMRVNTETGQVDRLNLKAASQWEPLGEAALDLAELEKLEEEKAEEPGAATGSSTPDAPLEISDDSELDALLEALGPGNPGEIRAWAAGLLGRYAAEAPERSLPALIVALADPDAAVVAAAARSLGRSDRPEALSALRSLEAHPDARVQEAAREALARPD